MWLVTQGDHDQRGSTLGGQLVTIETGKDTELRVGDVVLLGIDPTRIHILVAITAPAAQVQGRDVDRRGSHKDRGSSPQRGQKRHYRPTEAPCSLTVPLPEQAA